LTEGKRRLKAIERCSRDRRVEKLVDFVMKEVKESWAKHVMVDEKE